MKFTQSSIASAAKSSGADEVNFWDDELPGFGIRAQNGRARWTIMFRVGSKQRRMSLGKTSKVSLDAARKEAKKLFEDVARRIDPSAVRTKTELAASSMFEKAAEDFIEYQAARRGGAASYLEAMTVSMRERFKPLHGLALADIERGTVVAALRKISNERGPVSSDRARAHLSRFFNWAIACDLYQIDINPVDKTFKAAGDRAPRDRVLKAAEMKAIWHALPDDNFGRIVKVLALTGQRRNEIGNLCWSEIDFEEGIIHLPGERTKNNLPHDVPLSKLALAILKSAPTNDRKHVFGTWGSSGFIGWSKSKKRLNGQLDLPGWTLHDLRRTASTWMNEIDVLPHVVEAVLNHVSGEAKRGVAGTYNHAKYNPQKREALDRLAKHITEVVGPTKPGLKLVA